MVNITPTDEAGQAIPVPVAPTQDEADRVNWALDEHERSGRIADLARECFVAAVGTAINQGLHWPLLAMRAFEAAEAFVHEAEARRIPYPEFADSDR
jgi:hypothetical protein